VNRVWLDVGAHIGSHSVPFAYADPTLHVHAFEPHPRVAKWLTASASMLPNYTVWPVAVGVKDGFSDFYLSSDDGDGCSSLLPFDPDGLKRWVGTTPVPLGTTEIVSVPIIRLDTFLNREGIQHVDYLKVDAQGTDLDVVRSLGDRIKDVAVIMVEVIIAEVSLYMGQSEKDALVEFLQQAGFQLQTLEWQTIDPNGIHLDENLTFVR